jgi:hypothetical protein
VTGALGLLLREVGRGEQPAGVLVGAADVDEVLRADRLHGLVAEGPDREVLLLRGVRRLGTLRDLVGQLAAVELPLLAATVEELEVGVPVALGDEAGEA